MALANVGWILASRGKRVLLVDWDLEAPGLHRYLHPFLEDRELMQSQGVIDVLTEFVVASRHAHRAGTPPDDGEWFRPYADVLGSVLPVAWEHFPAEGVLDFLPAGRQGSSYGLRVTGFNWQEFYDALGGVVFLQALKENLRAEYDYVLVDSRTGLSDAAGTCTVQLPDDLVVCFTLNRQSLDGAAAVANSAFRQRLKPSGEPGMLVWPVPTRVELAERDRLEQGRRTARRLFLPFLKHLSRVERDVYWGRMEVLYQPYFAYEEVLATLADRKRQTASILASMEALTEYVTHGAVRDGLAEIDEKHREKGLRAYGVERKDEEPAAPSRKFIFVSYSQSSKSMARRLVDALEARFGEGQIWVDYKRVRLGESWRDLLERALQSTALVLAAFGPSADMSTMRRMELEAAVAAKIPLVPVLFNTDADVLSALPASLQELRFRNGAMISQTNFDEDVETLVAGIRHLMSDAARSDHAADPEDPQKGRWGGRAASGGRTLTAAVTTVSDDWFAIVLEVVGVSERPLTGTVEFHLHPSFSPSLQTVEAESNRAVLRLAGWGAFTAGVSADDGNTRLELDLSELPDTPPKFRER
jgi:MinD-like ATPase involved in chromosome partitioning or flagellar assembly